MKSTQQVCKYTIQYCQVMQHKKYHSFFITWLWSHLSMIPLPVSTKFSYFDLIVLMRTLISVLHMHLEIIHVTSQSLQCSRKKLCLIHLCYPSSKVPVTQQVLNIFLLNREKQVRLGSISDHILQARKLTLSRNGQTISVKGQRENILCFFGHLDSFTIT